MEEPRLFKGGEVDFKLRSNRDLPPEAWQSSDHKWGQSSRPAPFSSWLILLIAIAILCFWMGACRRSDDMVTLKTSDGKTLRVTKQQWLDMYIGGGHFDWDATRNPHPYEPGNLGVAPTPGVNTSGPK